MRRMSLLVTGFCCIVGVGILSGQQPGRPGGFGGTPGSRDPGSLIRNPQVQKELDLTEEQIEKIPEAYARALKEVLNEKQLKRLHQIDIQQRGVDALKDVKVQKDLKISSEQAENIETVLKESRAERAKLFQGGFGKDSMEKSKALKKESEEKIMEVLTADQRKAYKQLLGEEFKMETPRFGGGNFGGGNFGKKKGTEKKDQ